MDRIADFLDAIFWLLVGSLATFCILFTFLVYTDPAAAEALMCGIATDSTLEYASCRTQS